MNIQSLIDASSGLGEPITGQFAVPASSAERYINVPVGETWLITSLGASNNAGTAPEYYVNGQFQVNGYVFATFTKQGSLSNIRLVLKGGSQLGFKNIDTVTLAVVTYSGFKLK